NGKTTTTTLVGQILKQANKKIFIGGNIGIPLIEYAQRLPQADFVVAEISSFQLQWVEKFHPFISVLLNMTNDHTDYHGSFAEYVRIKSKIFAEQTAKDITIINADDPAQRELTEKIRSKVVAFSSKRELREGIFVKGDQIIFKMQGFAEEMYPLKMIKLPGWHNVENVMAAVVAARFCDADRQSIESCVSNFYGLSHRIEYVGEKNSIKFYDDSKGTNVGAVVRALETFSQPVILLLGGRDKDGDFETLKPMLSQKAKKIILFGEARERISSLIGKGVKKVIIPKMRDAIEVAYKKARPGDIVLLSPGCASFDEFRDYKERGEYFKRIVRSL
ncbi:MAG TPA: UDP-N-acetylmuramoyl-L-alanine--D-glutamate ligase, partial [Smithellaceae bacterium]|nr:UDP-N-acetylmuramoyl-L-alanine--D-glutamate ligase [Smithellaceae bacterium]